MGSGARCAILRVVPSPTRRSPTTGFLAGRAFNRYRRAGGVRASPLPDFYIGAHAATDGLTLVTRDVGRYRTCFPSVKLVTPDNASS